MKASALFGFVVDVGLVGLGVGFLCFGLYSCSVTPRAAMRARAENKLKVCVNGGNNERECLAESSRFCKDAGLEASCGADGLWTEQGWRR